jgi:hypothetical protein
MIRISPLAPADARYRKVVPAGAYWMHVVRQSETLRIVDLEGNQAVDTLFFNADEPAEHYSAVDTIREQGNIYLSTGTVLQSDLCRPMLTITADTVGRHDTLGGACSTESNTVRYALEKKAMHACRDSFLLADRVGGGIALARIVGVEEERVGGLVALEIDDAERFSLPDRMHPISAGGHRRTIVGERGIENAVLQHQRAPAQQPNG